MVELVIKTDKLVIRQGDCLDIMRRRLTDNSVDAIVTDPPYGLEFMGKDWDKFGRNTGNGYQEKPRMNNGAGLGGYKERPNYYTAGHPFQQWCTEWAKECLRVLKPGGHILAFGGTRTWHRLAVAIEDAGFEMRDSIAWLYGSGFPKSLDVSKAIDKAAGAEREVVGIGSTSCADFPAACAGHPTANNSLGGGIMRHAQPTKATSDAAKQWAGWGTALKPAFEPIVVGRKPLIGTVAANVLAHGTGALNIDATRIGTDDDRSRPPRTANALYGGGNGTNLTASESNPAGRWPANVVLDEIQEPVLHLKDNLPIETERLIREFFGASTDHLSKLQSDNASASEPSESETILFSEVLCPVDESESSGREGSSLEETAYAGDASSNIRNQESKSSNGREILSMERGSSSRSGILDSSVLDAYSRGADSLPIDGDTEQSAGDSRAQISDGALSEAPFTARGDSTSSQRNQSGQSTRKSRVAFVEQFAQNETRTSGSGDVSTAERKRDNEARTLEVLQRLVPAGWLDYFQDTGRTIREGMAEVLDEQTGTTVSRIGKPRGAASGDGWGMTATGAEYTDSGGASRFFYCAKSPAKERPKVDGVAHATVKPLTLMRWLCKLVTPPDGLILDPFLGSGTTAQAALLEGFRCYGIEREESYIPLIKQRLDL